MTHAASGTAGRTGTLFARVIAFAFRINVLSSFVLEKRESRIPIIAVRERGGWRSRAATRQAIFVMARMDWERKLPTRVGRTSGTEPPEAMSRNAPRARAEGLPGGLPP
eukprot:scaffold125588_cov32-Tisochrysis_lutea.AAC.2